MIVRIKRFKSSVSKLLLSHNPCPCSTNVRLTFNSSTNSFPTMSLSYPTFCNTAQNYDGERHNLLATSTLFKRSLINTGDAFSGCKARSK